MYWYYAVRSKLVYSRVRAYSSIPAAAAGWYVQQQYPEQREPLLQVLLLAVEPAFASHAVHDEEPAGENVLGGQERHIDAGQIVEPAGHVEHSAGDAAPIKGRCVPAGQETHVPDPSGHVVQFALEDAPRIAEYLPRSHSIHVAAEDAPSALEYFPALHFSQRLSESAPVEGRYLPDPHWIHDAEDIDPTRVEYAPMAQSKQAVDALIAEY